MSWMSAGCQKSACCYNATSSTFNAARSQRHDEADGGAVLYTCKRARENASDFNLQSFAA
jgi:hypothetical protein